MSESGLCQRKSKQSLGAMIYVSWLLLSSHSLTPLPFPPLSPPPTSLWSLQLFKSLVVNTSAKAWNSLLSASARSSCWFFCELSSGRSLVCRLIRINWSKPTGYIPKGKDMFVYVEVLFSRPSVRGASEQKPDADLDSEVESAEARTNVRKAEFTLCKS